MGLQPLAEAPLEALVFRHSATAGGSLWTWLAVLAAALGLWLIRSAAAAPKPESTLRSGRHAAPAHGESSHNLPQPKAARQKHQPLTKPEAWPPSPSGNGGDVGFTRKGTVFELRRGLVEEEDDDDDDDDEGGGFEEDEVPKEEEEYPWSGEGGVVTVDCRWRGDLGWYRYQDMAALNGRVVKLWEEEKRVAAAAAGGVVGQLDGVWSFEVAEMYIIFSPGAVSRRRCRDTALVAASFSK